LGDFTVDNGSHSEDLPTIMGSRTIHSHQLSYTNEGTGALSLKSDAITPGRNAIKIYWLEIDITESNGSHDWTMHMEFPAGHEYANHEYLVNEWSGVPSNAHQVLYGDAGGGGVVVPPGAIFHLACTGTVDAAVYKIHFLYEIL